MSMDCDVYISVRLTVGPDPVREGGQSTGEYGSRNKTVQCQMSGRGGGVRTVYAGYRQGECVCECVCCPQCHVASGVSSSLLPLLLFP